MSLDLETVALFVRVAALGNVSAAGRERGLSPAAASTRLTQLEAVLGARLFHRTTRRVALTQEGDIFLVQAQALLMAEAQALASVGQGHAAPKDACGCRVPRRSGGNTFRRRYLRFLRSTRAFLWISV